MKRHGDLATFAEFASLQRLVALRDRETLAAACERTGRQLHELGKAQGELERCSAWIDALFRADSLCLDRLSLAGDDLVRCDAKVESARALLSETQDEEDTARSACREGIRRLGRAEQQLRKLRRKQLSKREVDALCEAVGLRTLRSMAP